MICKKCNTDFDANMCGTRCPNCDTDNPLQSFDNAADATKYVIDLYGKEILRNGKKFFGIVNDIIPRLIKEKNMFLHMYKENVFSILYNADGKKDVDKKMAMIVSARRLIDNVGLSEQTAVDAIEYIISALNWNVKLDVTSLKIPNTSASVKNANVVLSTVNKSKAKVKKIDKKKIAVCAISAILVLGLFGIIIFKNVEKEELDINDYIASDEYRGEYEYLFEGDYREEGDSFYEEYSEEENNEGIIYSDEKTYKNSYTGTEKSVSGFEEELTISTKNKKTKFSNGVEVTIISDNSDNETLKLMYEVYNPTDYPIKFDADDPDGGIVYNKNNEIVDRDNPYFTYYEYIIFPKSSILFEASYDIDGLNSVSEIGRIETKVKVKSANVKPVKSITISNVEFSGDSVNYKVKTGEIQNEMVDCQISFLDKKGKIVAHATNAGLGCLELFSNSTEHKTAGRLFLVNNNNTIEKIVFYAYY